MIIWFKKKSINIISSGTWLQVCFSPNILLGEDVNQPWVDTKTQTLKAWPPCMSVGYVFRTFFEANVLHSETKIFPLLNFSWRTSPCSWLAECGGVMLI